MAEVISSPEEKMPEEMLCAWRHVGTAVPPSKVELIVMFSLGVLIFHSTIMS